jgi:DNA-binding transcriptional regulator YiaG
MPRTQPSTTKKNKEAERLKKLRKDLGMTVRAFAKEFNVAIGSVSQWENGGRTIPGPMIKLIEIYEERMKSGK